MQPFVPIEFFFRPKNGGLKRGHEKTSCLQKTSCCQKTSNSSHSRAKRKKNKRRQRQLSRRKVLKIKISQKKPKKKGLLRTKRSNQRQAASRTEKRGTKRGLKQSHQRSLYKKSQGLRKEICKPMRTQLQKNQSQPRWKRMQI